MPTAQIAEELNRSVRAVDNKIDSLGLRKNPTGVPEGDREIFWRKRANELERELQKAREVRTATDVLVEQVASVAPLSYDTAPALKIAKKSGVSSPQSAMLLLSDTHVGAYVRPEQTLGFGQYDFDIFCRRLKRLEDSVGSILHDHTTTDVSELVVGMLGDMIDGALQHSAECGQVNTLFSQFYGAGHALAQFLRNVATMVPKVRVYTCVGNHPRWGTQKKMPTKNRFSNLDQFLYAFIASLVRDIPTIEFTLNQQPFAEFKVQGFTFLAAHGDHLRGGDKALGIPSHAIGRNVSAGAQLRLKCNRPGVNYYVLGHLHRPMELPHSGGEILVNGGFPGIDEYGLTESFVACEPMQKFFFVHPKHGRAACYSLNLKHAKMDGPTPYKIPSGFPVS